MKRALRGSMRCDIVARLLLPSGHIHRWWIVPILDTTSRKSNSGLFTDELCIGDLSIRMTSSMGCGSLDFATASN